MRVGARISFTARFARDVEFAERIYIFFSAERAEKKKSYSVMAMKIIVWHRNNTIVNKMTVSPQGLVLFVFLCPVSPAFQRDKRKTN
jgi:hypothetical protein